VSLVGNLRICSVVACEGLEIREIVCMLLLLLAWEKNWERKFQILT
jgi:hypothetical protein